MTGEPSLPHELQVGRFLEAREAEIKALEGELVRTGKGKLASQQVPKHMRRRAVSHNPRRLPRRLRPAHTSQRDKSGGEGRVAKRPSRRHRRRPKNLIEEYIRRQRPGRPVWLETHLWHAKRFHMGDFWGCKVPHFPNDKAWRACYRAASTKCLMWDFSYLRLTQIEGSVALLLTKLNQLTRENCGARFSFGPGESSAMLFEAVDSKRPLGEVSFMWRPPSDPSLVGQAPADIQGSLWLWCHPGFYQQLIKLLHDTLNLQFPEDEDDSPKKKKACKLGVSEDNFSNEELCQDDDSDKRCDEESGIANGGKLQIDKADMVQEDDGSGKTESKKRKRSVHLAKLTPRLADPTVLLSTCGQVKVTLLEHRVNRFRLVGPHTLPLLAHALQPACLETSSQQQTDQLKSNLAAVQDHWWTDWIGGRKVQEHNVKSWESCWAGKRLGLVKKPAPILGLLVRDPRLVLPQQRNSFELKADQPVKEAVEATWQSQQSPIWCKDLRERASKAREEDSVINRLRGEALVPGTPLFLGDRESRVPVVVVQRGTGASDWGAGCDVLVGAGWGATLWQLLVHSGARVGGLREWRHFLLEAGVPGGGGEEDSAWGTFEREKYLLEKKVEHFKLPPDKRVNYAVLGAGGSCWKRPWGALLTQWASDPDAKVEKNDFHVIRDMEVLRKLANGEAADVDDGDRSLVPVLLEVEGKGRLSQQTLLCLPFPGDEEDLDLVEPLHEDAKEGERKEKRNEHKLTKKRLKRQWKKLKSKQVLVKAQAVIKDEEPNQEKVEMITKNMEAVKEIREKENETWAKESERLWSPDDEKLRTGFARELAGWVVEGDFCYRTGGHRGIGYISFRAFQRLEEKRWLWVRELTSLQYRRAKFFVLT